MRAVNLYTLTRKIDNEIYVMYEMALSDRAEAIRIRMEEIDQILAERRKNWKPVEAEYKKGVLRLFSQHAASPMKGAYLEY
mgnify:CR=1 FL=1